MLILHWADQMDANTTIPLAYLCFKLATQTQQYIMKVGCHVSIAQGVDKAVDRAVNRECTAFQIFSRNPRGWHAKPIPESESTSFREKVSYSGIDKEAICVHMPYLPNLAGPNKEPYEKSVNTLKDEVRRCDLLKVRYLVTHLGSHLGTGSEAGIKRLVDAYTEAAKIDNDVVILLENMAGQKNAMGYDFKELSQILNQLHPKEKFGVCLDTCHAFVAGYDLSTAEAASKTLQEFDELIGKDRLKILHLNDAKGELGCRRDRHDHIGLGHIGEEGLGEVVRTMNRRGIPIILETPIDDTRTDIDNIMAAKRLA